ncbi:hypothetical protein BJV78DRAFT_1284286 [Lactifluus subvellereus]|nr:hypothetical protein BJV78DRAFT_1284286 [Lactifluus subvellereus]
MSVMAPRSTTSSKTTKFFQLPTEVVIKILALVDINELLACRAVSAPNQILSESLSSIQYHIHLATSGMCDGLQSGVSTTERMAARRPKTRLGEDWLVHDKIDIPASGMPQCLDRLVVSFSQDRKAVTVHQLPSKLRALEACHWTLGFKFAIARFTVDASQGLLALVLLCATPSPAQWHVSTFELPQVRTVHHPPDAAFG